MTRRSLLAWGAGGLAGRLAAWQPKGVRLKITRVKLVRLRVIREAGALEPAWNPGGRMAIQVGGGTLTEVHTDQGLVGIGPGMDPRLAPAVEAALTGEDPFQVTALSARLQTHARGVGYQGCAGADIALWDLVGKACGQPLYRLLGGGRDRVPAYASMILLGTPEERARLAGSLASEGWKAIKLRLHHPTLAADVRTVELVKAEVGDRMALLTDANQAQAAGEWQRGVLWDYARARDTARELERLGCFWLEEPLPRYAFDQLAKLAREVRIPLAGGENNPRLEEFRTMVETGAYDILQPESMVLGGITPVMRIGALAELFNKQVAPHHGGRQLGTIAHLHLIAAWPYAPYFEVLHDPPVGDYRHGWAIFREPPRVDADGMVAVPQRPGLGVEIDPDLVLRKEG